MIFSIVYTLTRCLLGCVMVLARREVSKDAELLVLRHENAVLRRLPGSKSRPSPVTWGDERSVAVGHDDQPCPFACST